jgi:hypothetical protein
MFTKWKITYSKSIRSKAIIDNTPLSPKKPKYMLGFRFSQTNSNGLMPYRHQFKSHLVGLGLED